MKKTLVFIFFAFFPLFYAGAASPLEINLNKTEYFPGDKIIMKTEFINTYTQEVVGVLFCSIEASNNEMPPMPTMIEINLKPGEKSEKLECAMTIGEAMPEGIYRAEAEVMDQNKTTVIKNEKEFIVSGTKAIFEATKEGSFALKINLDKQGFVNQEIDKDFAVIAAPVKIKSASVCQVDNKCTGKETEQNCPQDCVIENIIFPWLNILDFTITQSCGQFCSVSFPVHLLST